MRIYLGQSYAVVGKNADSSWVQLNVNGQTGWVRQGDIAVANNISDPQKIRAGMELVIPGWQAAGGKSGKAAPNACKTVERCEYNAPLGLPVVPEV